MNHYDAPPADFQGLPSAQLLAAGLTWLEHAAHAVNNGDEMNATSEAISPDADGITRRLLLIEDRLFQLRNIGEARLAASIGHALIEAARVSTEVSQNMVKMYGPAATDG